MLSASLGAAPLHSAPAHTASIGLEAAKASLVTPEQAAVEAVSFQSLPAERASPRRDRVVLDDDNDDDVALPAQLTALPAPPPPLLSLPSLPSLPAQLTPLQGRRSRRCRRS
jgi:hypothetical protein